MGDMADALIDDGLAPWDGMYDRGRDVQTAIDFGHVTRDERKFWDFHAQNPAVYAELVSLARTLRDRGHRKYGIGALFEVVRFHRDLKTTGDKFKLNNNYRAYYARLIMEREESLAGFFNTRRSRADG